MRFLIALALTYLCLDLQGQNEGRANETETKNFLSADAGYTFIPQGEAIHYESNSGFFVPCIGLNYMRSISEKLEIGAMLEMELDDYLVVDRNLKREKVLVMAAVIVYRFGNELSLIAGPGYETDRNKSFSILKIGIEKGFYLKDSTWKLVPGFFFNIKEGYDTWSVNLCIGKDF